MARYSILLAVCSALALYTTNGATDVNRNETNDYYISFDQRQAILNAVNSFRSQLAQGYIYKELPKAANILAVSWDDRLEGRAQEKVDKCLNELNDYTTDLNAIGKVMVIHSSISVKESKLVQLQREFQRWISGAQSYDFDNKICDADTPVQKKNCQRFVQLASSFMSKVACAVKKCNSDKLQLACMAKNDHPDDLALYIRGEPCTACPESHNYCLSDSLCMTYSQCSNSPFSRDACRCLVKAEECSANSQFNSDICACSCKPDGKDCKKLLMNANTSSAIEPNNRDHLSVNIIKEPIKTKSNILLIETIQNTGCVDKHESCSAWIAGTNYCTTSDYVKNMCPAGCKICTGPGGGGGVAPPLPPTTASPSGGPCADNNPNCALWAKNPAYCQKEYLLANCKASCGLCGAPGKTVAPLKIDCQRPETNYCQQIKSDTAKCQSFPKIREICPITCGICPSGSGNGIPTKPTEPVACAQLKNLCATAPNIRKTCVLTCAGIPLATSSTSAATTLSTSTVAAPAGPCADLTDSATCTQWKGQNYCLTSDYVKKYCKKTCMLCSNQPGVLSTTGLSTSSSSTEDPNCKVLSKLCFRPQIKQICPITCKVMSTTLAPTTINSRCLALKSLCYQPAIQVLCPVVCKDVTTTVSTTLGSTTENMQQCLSLKSLCYVPTVKAKCPIVCSQVSTTPPPTTVNPKCLALKSLCYQAAIQVLCPVVCKGVTITSTLPPTTENPTCLGLKPLCGKEAVQKLCPDTCKGVPIITTTTVVPTTPNAKCIALKSLCYQPAIRFLCPVICKDEPISTSTTAAVSKDAAICPSVKQFCLTSANIRSVCPESCKGATQAPICNSLDKLQCNDPSIRKLCPVLCIGFSTSLSSSTLPSTTATTTASNEPPVCIALKSSCAQETINNLCPITCNGVTVSTAMVSTTPNPKTLDFFCTLLTPNTCNMKLQAFCPKQCPKEPAICPPIKHMCNEPKIKSLCYQTCSGA